MKEKKGSLKKILRRKEDDLVCLFRSRGLVKPRKADKESRQNPLWALMERKREF